jgi:hypothetical protein
MPPSAFGKFPTPFHNASSNLGGGFLREPVFHPYRAFI